MECAATVKVEGLSRKFADKHLWVFAHVQFLNNQWWPQAGVVNLNADGKWLTRAYLGIENDIGYDFEIVVRWVTP